MSKRSLQKYLTDLSKEELEEQVLELYNRIKEVKTFYDFVFNPREEKLFEAAKFKISKEYFPPNRRKAKKRRSVAQKEIKQFRILDADPSKIADLMLYTIEIALVFNADSPQTQLAFYKSYLNTYNEFIKYTTELGIISFYEDRIHKIVKDIEAQEWPNSHLYELPY
ncbi:DUF6155 family protein [Crocinitomix catalasitica]|uniref:DUF6155 family protein n=1 Tax=Crocinitomix catalasitica TaxID=184607 RepID=UPI00048100C0|nr:DUF6155 family protein [Crocinitomix catalasitica]